MLELRVKLRRNRDPEGPEVCWGLEDGRDSFCLPEREDNLLELRVIMLGNHLWKDPITGDIRGRIRYTGCIRVALGQTMATTCCITC